MRYGLLALALCVCVAIQQGWLAEAYDGATGAVLGEDARVAIELRCKGRSGRAIDECRRLLKKLYLAGTLDPEKTLRAHCTRGDVARWGTRRPTPPALCVQRYGGWQPG